MNRRNFIRQAIAASAAIALAPKILFAHAKRYILQGDGVRDDSKSLQAWLDGEQVFYRDGEQVTPTSLKPGTYRVQNAIYFRDDGRHIVIKNSHFKLGPDAYLDFSGGSSGEVTGNYFEVVGKFAG